MVTVKTTWGPVPVWGRVEPSDRPLLILLRGAWPHRTHYDGVVDALPDLDIALFHLPGMHTPPTADPSIRRFAAMYDEVLERQFPDRPVHVLGFSMGGVTALALRNPRVRMIIATDPPLDCRDLWPLREVIETPPVPEHRQWADAVFGRDHADLLDDLRARTLVLLATDPLHPERPTARMPSLVSERDRRLFKEHPLVNSWTVMDTGHNIPRDGQGAIWKAIRLATGR